MDPLKESSGSSQVETSSGRSRTLTRRHMLRLAVGGSIGLSLDGILDLQTVRAATREMKLSQVKEYTTSCNFCSCGCGMIASVREGKLIAMEIGRASCRERV